MDTPKTRKQALSALARLDKRRDEQIIALGNTHAQILLARTHEEALRAGNGVGAKPEPEPAMA